MNLRGSRYGPFYGCEKYPACTGSHKAHKDGSPMGIPANAETKQARIKAHDAFDRLWFDKAGREKAYFWLANKLDQTEDECHIGRFDIATCQKVVDACKGVRRSDVEKWARKND